MVYPAAFRIIRFVCLLSLSLRLSFSVCLLNFNTQARVGQVGGGGKGGGVVGVSNFLSVCKNSTVQLRKILRMPR